MPTKTVNFGSSRAGLATVGYRIVTSAGVVGARVTAGVYEIGGGGYGADVAVGTGSLRWDTGEATPLYAADEQTPSVDVRLGNGEAVVFDETLSDDIDSVLTRLGSGTVRIIGHVVNYDLIIGRGESYNTTVGQTLVWTKATGDVWPTDITGWTITLNAAAKGNNTASGTATLQATGTVTTATGSDQAFRIDLTAAQTTDLAEGHWTHVITLTSGANVKALRGNMLVLPELPVDA